MNFSQELPAAVLPVISTGTKVLANRAGPNVSMSREGGEIAAHFACERQIL